MTSRSPKARNLLLDIKYADFSGIQDIPNACPRADCYIVPPYKPLMYTALHSPRVGTNIYAFRGIKQTYKQAYYIIYTYFVHYLTYAEESAVSVPWYKKLSRLLKPGLRHFKNCQIVGPPLTYDKPVHPFFFRASRKVVNHTITANLLFSLFTCY